MSDKNVNQLAALPLPIQSTDQLVVSRDGINLLSVAQNAVVTGGTLVGLSDYPATSDLRYVQLSESAINICAPPYNAKGDLKIITDGAMSNGSHVLNTATVFSSADVGKLVTVPGAGVAGANLMTTIASVTSGAASLTAAAGTTVSGKTVYYGTDNIVSIDAATTVAYNAVGGGMVFFPPGNYGVSRSVGSVIGYNGNVGFIGASKFASTITMMGTDDVVRVSQGYPITNQLFAIPNTTIRSLGLDGNAGGIVPTVFDTFCNGINLNWPANAAIDDCYIRNIVYQGAVCGNGDPSTGTGTNNHIRGCLITTCGEIGAGMEGAMFDSDISNNYIYGLPLDGIHIGSGGGQINPGCRIQNNGLHNIAGAGITVQDGSNGAIVSGNYLRKCGTVSGAGIYMAQFFTTYSNGVLIEGNTLDGCGNTNAGGFAQCLMLHSNNTTNGGNVLADNIFINAPAGVGNILCNSGVNFTVRGGMIIGQGGTGTVADYGIDIQGGTANTLIDRVGLMNIPSAATGFQIGAGGVTGTRIIPGAVTNVTTLFTDQGTNTTVEGVEVTYDPTLLVAASGGGFVFGNAGGAIRVTKNGKAVSLSFTFTRGSSTNMGTGVLNLTVPIQPDQNANLPDQVGCGWANIGTANGVSPVLTASSSGITFYMNTGGTGTATPITGANFPATSQLFVQITYQAAF